MTENQYPRLVSVEEIRRRLDVCNATIYNMIKRGELPPLKKMGRNSRWHEADIEPIIEEFVHGKNQERRKEAIMDTFTWTTGPPAVPGSYWLREQWRSKKWASPEIVRIVFDDETQCLQIKGRRVRGGVANYGTDSYITQWAGPIPIPVEQ